jgi:ATP-dependent Lhr-like helicase
MDEPALARFAAPVRDWFVASFGAPTAVQARGWPHIQTGGHSLLLAPTGSGKTLAAFLACIDRLIQLPRHVDPGVRVVYVSPLKALAYDIERNLRLPLEGISRAAERLGVPVRPVTVSIRTGDTPAKDRRGMLRAPGDILITTPESLYLVLAGQAREILRSVETIIVDEIHALAPTKRGAHLALSLERLAELSGREPQRIGLSATAGPLAGASDNRSGVDEIARYLVGGRDGREREVAIVDAGEKPNLDLTIEVPADLVESGAPPRAQPSDGATQERFGAWPAIHDRLLELVRAHRSTIVFANSRRLCERLAQQLNQLAGQELVLAHHGSIAREQRTQIEARLKAGELRGIVATSSLELGIDMGAVDLVVQVESPGSVARGLQRAGRAGHGVGQRSQARILPKYRADLLETAVVARLMLDGAVDAIVVPRNPLDVLAQQIVAMVAERPWDVDELFALVRRAHSYRSLPRTLYEGVLDMLAGRYPSDAFADLRPRLIWDRNQRQLAARRDARLLAIVNGGTIPDRGLYAVHFGAAGPRIGELDEEMVHELRLGETFLLGASSWRAVEITRDRVIVEAAPGEPGKMPFWHGDGPGRPLTVGRALGALIRALGEREERDALPWLEREYRLDARAARNLWRYVSEQKQATGTLPSDDTLVIERFRDELGDWRVCILSPFGSRVHAPWALALGGLLSQRAGFEVQSLWSDDGIALRFAAGLEGDAPPPAVAQLVPEAERIEELLLAQLGRSALFATHFRENAARALLLPRRRAGTRTPLWAQRIRAANLLAVALQHSDFPMVLETYRECLNDVFDVPALIELLRRVARGEVRVVEVETPSPSPFARSLAFAYVAAYLYEGDAPIGERKAQALTLDRNLLRELLGDDQLRDLLEPAAVDEVEAELQALAEERRARHADAVHDLLRRVGDLSEAEVALRSAGDPRPLLATLAASGRALELRIAGELRWVAVEDVAKYRDGLGAALPAGVPAAFLAPVERPLEALLQRWARTHGPFAATGEAPARRFGLTADQLQPALRALVTDGRLLLGEFRPGQTGAELCAPEVLRRLRRTTLARLRNEVAPVEAPVLGRFLPRWHGVGDGGRGVARLRQAIEQLEGLALPLSELERAILPARVSDFQPRMLDELGASGEVVWIGHGQVGDEGRIALYRRGEVAALLAPAEPATTSPLAERLLAHLQAHGASFVAQLPGATEDPDAVTSALSELVWAGRATNDTFRPLRALLAPRRTRTRLVFAAGGRWSAVSEVLGVRPSETVQAHARAQMLLRRYGIVSRAAAAAEELPGGFTEVAPVLRAMEEAGKIRRGHFVEGLEGMQVAHPGAVDRLRAERDGAVIRCVSLSAIDPANAYGALLPWPARDGKATPRRVAGAEVVLANGEPVFYIERGGKHLRLFPLADEQLYRAAFAQLRSIAARRRHRQLRIEEIDGEAALHSPRAALLERGGFRVEPGALVLSAE